MSAAEKRYRAVWLDALSEATPLFVVFSSVPPNKTALPTLRLELQHVDHSKLKPEAVLTLDISESTKKAAPEDLPAKPQTEWQRGGGFAEFSTKVAVAILLKGSHLMETAPKISTFDQEKKVPTPGSLSVLGF